MIKIAKKEDCCGCTACASICNHEAITMKPDALGFLYPEVDMKKCVDCGLCEKVCAFNDNYDKSLNSPYPEAYGVRHKSIDEIMKSRSGAAFAAISDYVLAKGGFVYGAGYKDHFIVVHKRAKNKIERNEFRGSKYVQSDLTGVFKQVKDDLKNGFLVLFSGTPCQTSGLNSFIGKHLRGNLLLVDMLCHGVPGPFVWRDYLEYLEKKENDIIVRVNFRDKELFGWRAHNESFKFKNEGEKGKMIYSYVFYKHIMFRKSCSKCHFTNLIRPSDITLGDFWHSEKIDPDFNKDNKGASLILLNTPKGKEIFEAIKDKVNYIPVDIDKCKQKIMSNPIVEHPMRMQFEAYYAKHGFAKTMKRFGFLPGFWHVWYCLKEKFNRKLNR